MPNLDLITTHRSNGRQLALFKSPQHKGLLLSLGVKHLQAGDKVTRLSPCLYITYCVAASIDFDLLLHRSAAGRGQFRAHCIRSAVSEADLEPLSVLKISRDEAP
ncbi:hypothetical protein CgunFtcFv8_023217 [Champsocephalus gunnari]|uniref:Uncharacterized protein n=1 Tax=Champsocephalus gunnari TaxID=52237 RepID=A0AAN8HPI8_CHAGU|nr:hypothetical protein CgunFtcFv8_023217 [Champsocephalus gunnari]